MRPWEKREQSKIEKWTLPRYINFEKFWQITSFLLIFTSCHEILHDLNPYLVSGFLFLVNPAITPLCQACVMLTIIGPIVSTCSCNQFCSSVASSRIKLISHSSNSARIIYFPQFRTITFLVVVPFRLPTFSIFFNTLNPDIT